MKVSLIKHFNLWLLPLLLVHPEYHWNFAVVFFSACTKYWTKQNKTKQKSVAKTIAVDLKEAYEWVKAEEEAEKYCIAQVFSFG